MSKPPKPQPRPTDPKKDPSLPNIGTDPKTPGWKWPKK